MDDLMTAVKTCWRLTYALALCSIVWQLAGVR